MNKFTKHIPNFLTCMNLLCGCAAIVCISKNILNLSATLVLAALVFDYADGFVARMLNVRSEIGKQLDSLADMVTFGVVPAMTMHQLMINSIGVNETPDIFYCIKIYFPFIIAVFSALRLAKFNIDTRQTDSFIGLPTPACTLFIVSFPLIIMYDDWGVSSVITNPVALFFLSAVLSFLLVAEIPLFALKFKNFKWEQNKIQFIFLGLSLVLIPVFKFASVPLIIILYVVLSLISKKESGNRN